jgi:hypothetical protein
MYLVTCHVNMILFIIPRAGVIVAPINVKVWISNHRSKKEKLFTHSKKSVTTLVIYALNETK